jgi:predicted amidophosphoribosyltransferase
MNQDQADPQQPAQLHYISGISFQSESTFDDIWARYSDICEYCAAEISYEDKRCPNCGQRIYASYYRYPQASSDLARKNGQAQYSTIKRQSPLLRFSFIIIGL